MRIVPEATWIQAPGTLRPSGGRQVQVQSRVDQQAAQAFHHVMSLRDGPRVSCSHNDHRTNKESGTTRSPSRASRSPADQLVTEPIVRRNICVPLMLAEVGRALTAQLASRAVALRLDGVTLSLVIRAWSSDPHGLGTRVHCCRGWDSLRYYTNVEPARFVLSALCLAAPDLARAHQLWYRHPSPACFRTPRRARLRPSLPT